MFEKLIRKIDMYGGSIGFTFKGQKTHTTEYGGICSLISIVFLALFWGLKMVDILGRLEPSISMIEQV